MPGLLAHHAGMSEPTPQTWAIAGRYFQPALSSAALADAPFFNNRIGAVISDTDDINQCIDVILGTPRGSQPHRPLFGADIQRYIDWPVNVARPHLTREIITALRAWEPRIDLLSVRVYLTELATLAVQIAWRYRNTRGRFVSQFALAGGR